jgi:hypothetical protein
LSGTCSVSILFLGSYVEEAIVANMNTFYAEYPAHVESIRDDLLLGRFGPEGDEERAEEEGLEMDARLIKAAERLQKHDEQIEMQHLATRKAEIDEAAESANE